MAISPNMLSSLRNFFEEAFLDRSASLISVSQVPTATGGLKRSAFPSTQVPCSLKPISRPEEVEIASHLTTDQAYLICVPADTAPPSIIEVDGIQYKYHGDLDSSPVILRKWICSVIK